MEALSDVRTRLQKCVNSMELQGTRHPDNVTYTVESLLRVINNQELIIESQSREIARLRK